MKWIVSAVVSFLMGMLCCYVFVPTPEPVNLIDTVIVRDTIREQIPVPEYVNVIRYDTLRIHDTIYYPLPITQQTYLTSNYKAVIEGYKPKLVSLETYPKTTIITRTATKKPKWSITVGPGIGYGKNGIQPYIGISAGFVLWSK